MNRLILKHKDISRSDLLPHNALTFAQEVIVPANNRHPREGGDTYRKHTGFLSVLK
ncbi:MAG: hypothetical protein AB8B64_09435 [Granulosicoccus sp.]